MTIFNRLAKVIQPSRNNFLRKIGTKHQSGILTRWLLLLFFSELPASPLFSAGQDSTTYPFSLGIRPQYGFIIIHSKDIVPVKNSYPFGLSLEMSWHLNSKKAFEQCLCFPRIGISSTLWDYDNTDILGRGINSIFFIEPFYGINNKVSFSFRAGAGLAYANKPYDEITNPQNLSYSTRFSFALLVAANMNFRLSKKMMLSISANYNHISNGGMKQPNKGINYPTAGIGVDYYLRKPSFEKFPRTDWRQQSRKRDRFLISAFGTTRDVEIDGEEKTYPAGGFNLRFSRQVSRVNAVGGGLEVMADWSIKAKVEETGQSTDYFLAGLLLGNDFLLGQFLFGQQFGVYVYHPHVNNADFFQRYFLDYFFTKNISGGIGLKAHGHVADFLDFRIGFVF
ncbi:MAG: acyloxyacyl hydrolase [Bacteroidales bacterium]|nr:acyloxyacyl hydrolase [Bacteroidales bacterium]